MKVSGKSLCSLPNIGTRGLGRWHELRLDSAVNQHGQTTMSERPNSTEKAPAYSRADRDRALSDHWPTTHLQAYEGNRLLQLAGAEEYEQLAPHFETVKLRRRQILYRSNTPITHVYLPQTGVISMVSHLDNGRVVEVGTIGNEGMLGLPVFLAFDRTPVEAVVHIHGIAKRIRADVFRNLLSDCGAFHMVLHRYTLAYLTQVAQSAACNRAHSMTERCARWILMTQDRMGTDYFALTQDLLAVMLGSGRPGVSIAASGLQERGLIQYRRGRLVVTDRKGLEGAACECYGVVRQQFNRMLGQTATEAAVAE